MGVVISKVRFANGVPELHALRERVARRTGLDVGLEMHDPNHGELFFVCLPDRKVNVARWTLEQAKEIAATFADVGGPPGFRLEDYPCINLRIFLGQEPTLFAHAQRALAELGGEVRERVNDDAMEEWLQPVSQTELVARVHKVEKQNKRGFWIATVVGAPLIVLWLLLLPFKVAFKLGRLAWLGLRGRSPYEQRRV